MTMLELVNRVLRRLREDQVTALDDEYSMLIATFVADAHREVLDYHDWSRQDETIIVRLQSGQDEYDLARFLADGGDVYAQTNSNPTKEGSFLRFVNDRPLAWLLQNGVNDTDGQPMGICTWDALEYKFRQDADMTGIPTEFALRDSETMRGFRMRVWPTPNAEMYMKMRFHIPESSIDVEEAVDPGAITTELPWRPLVLGATLYALNERGEEMGEPGGIAERRFYASLAAAKEQDLNLASRMETFDFYRD